MSRRNVTISVRHGRRIGFWSILFHTVLTFATGGVWLVILLIWYVLR